MENQNDRPPLKSIEVNGTYKLKLIKPKFEKVKHNEDGTSSCRLFFLDDQGNCLSKSYGSKYAKPLAMEAIPNGEWNGKPQFKYKLTFPKGSQKPVVPDANTEAPPF